MHSIMFNLDSFYYHEYYYINTDSIVLIIRTEMF